MINLREKPFYLNDSDISWIRETIDTMPVEEKAGQVFCPIGVSGEEGYLRHLICELKVGGMMFRMAPKEELIKTNSRIQRLAKIPLLLAANLESGGNGAIQEGTTFGKPMSVAAAANQEMAYHMGKVACSEGAAVGINWAFAPIVDIDYEFRSPITNVRTFGNNPDDVIRYAKEYLKAADEENVAATIKHFPGDGTDERDQHLVTSVNNLSAGDWRSTYGKVYKTLIDFGAKTVMAGHIAQPELVKEYNSHASEKECLRPASLSKELLTDVLRKELGFNGLIVTDSTQMVGFSCAMPRKQAIPQAIENGCDMILFNRNLEEDFGYLLDGIGSGLLSMARLDEAVMRILALKASLGLIKRKEQGTLIPENQKDQVIGCELFRKWAAECADASITLVRDEQKLLPLSPEKTKRICLNVIQHDMKAEDPLSMEVKTMLEKEGFEVMLRHRDVKISVEDFMKEDLNPEKKAAMKELNRSVEEFKNTYDLYVYVVNMETASNNTVIRLNWNVFFGMGDDAPWFTEEIPAIFISMQNPYHLFDAPMMKTYINAYDNNEFSRAALLDKLMGRSAFTGISPVNPFCGKTYI